MLTVLKSLNTNNMMLLKAHSAKLQSALGYIIAFITKTHHTGCEVFISFLAPYANREILLPQACI